MPQRPNSAAQTEPPSTSGASTPMNAAQTARLRQLARDAYEPEAFSPLLSQAEAARRIATLQAKLKLMDEPPHTL